MAGALEILRAQRRADREAKNMNGAPENKSAPPRLPGLALASSRFSSKGARGLAIEHQLTAADFHEERMSGQQERYTIEDVQRIVEKKAKRAAAPPAGDDDADR